MVNWKVILIFDFSYQKSIYSSHGSTVSLPPSLYLITKNQQKKLQEGLSVNGPMGQEARVGAPPPEPPPSPTILFFCLIKRSSYFPAVTFVWKTGLTEDKPSISTRQLYHRAASQVSSQKSYFSDFLARQKWQHNFAGANRPWFWRWRAQKKGNNLLKK